MAWLASYVYDVAQR